MKKVKILQPFFIASPKGTRYMKDWEGEVSNEIAERHGSEGTCFLKVLDDVEDKTESNLKAAKK